MSAAFAIEPMEHGDRRSVLDVFDGLSDRSRRLRFHAAKPRLSSAELDRLVDVGRVGSHAVVAVERENGRAIGIARLVREERDARVAEVAYAVVDDWQGRGVGRRLAVALARRADAEGIRRLRAYIKRDNRAAIAVVHHIGVVRDRRFESDTVELVVELRA